MSAKNRGDRIQLLSKVVAKHFTPVPAAEDRSILEHLIYACCLEDASYEDADEAFHRLRESYFDWNEIRVTTVTELRETLHNLRTSDAAAVRIKKNLQSLFETRYSFDIDDMAKMNLGKAVQELEKLGGISKFVLGYVAQHALGGHSIPVSKSIMQILLATEVVTEAEASKDQTPGLERTIPKAKGIAFASCLHQLAVMALNAPDDKLTKTILKEAGVVLAEAPAKSSTGKKKIAKKAAEKKETPDASTKAAQRSSTKKSAKADKPSTKKKSATSTKGTSKGAGASKKITKRKPK
ncbi:MAG: hypothetical protein KDB22_12095 [Planctomycetales bacterium]|nr:hypothetical protein [Planctomycetales bacterium]